MKAIVQSITHLQTVAMFVYYMNQTPRMHQYHIGWYQFRNTGGEVIDCSEHVGFRTCWSTSQIVCTLWRYHSSNQCKKYKTCAKKQAV